MTHDVCVIGDINIDVIPKPIQKDTSIRQDGQVFVDDVVHRRGGQGANFAVALAQLERRTGFMGKVGQDRHGRFLADHLDEHGVRDHLTRSPAVKTGTTLAVTWEDGQRHYISHTENNAALRYEDIETSALAEYDHIARRGVWFSDHMLEEGNKELLKEAHEHGAETSIDLHWDPAWSRPEGDAARRRRLFLETLEHADFLMGNQEEYMALTQQDSLEAAVDKVKEYNSDIIAVIHQGEDGSTIINGEATHIPTQTVRDPINPTGTGDVYDASFLDAWMDGEGAEEAGTRATEIAVQHLRDER